MDPGLGPRPRTRPKAKTQAPKLQPKARLGPKPGNALDLHYSRHASGIHHLFALDLARLRTPEAVPSLFQVGHASLETMPNSAKSSKSFQMNEYGSVWAENSSI